MTAQIMDEVMYGEQPYVLTAAKGTGLFEPRAHGFEAGALRGCGYAVRHKRLVLERVTLALAAGEAPSLAGRMAKRGPDGWQLERLDMRMLFTGSLLVARGVIESDAVGVHPAWRYETVHELELDGGQLLFAAERTDKLGEVRARTRIAPHTREELAAWVDACFDQRY